MRKAVVIILVVAVIGAAGYFGYQRFQQRAQAAAQPTWEELSVKRGDISSAISATGEVLPEREASLALKTGGLIVDLPVEVGDRVKQGQLLVQLDTADLELAVRQAEAGLRTSEAQLRQLREPPNASDVAAAEAALASAQAALKDVLKGQSADQLAAAQAQVDQARAQLEQAQQAYDRVKDQPNIGLLPQSLQLQQATIGYESAQAQYRVATKGASAAQIAQAKAQIAQAQANLDRLKEGPKAEQVEIAEAAVEQAKIALEQAKNRQADAQLAAPWAGVITAVNLVQGALAQPGTPAFRIADDSLYHLSVEVDEVDIAGIKEGQPVKIEVDALPDQPLTGKVQSIAPVAQTTPTGGVAYKVRIDIDPTDAPLRAGMSATSTIVSSTRENALLVPNRAIQLERETGRTYVERLVNGTPERVEVKLGLRDEQQAEVRGGVQETDRLIIRKESSLQKLQQSFGGGQ